MPEEVFRTTDLADDAKRGHIEQALAGKRFRCVVRDYRMNGDFGFLGCDRFADDIYFRLSALDSGAVTALAKGASVEAEIGTVFLDKKMQYSFAVTRGSVLSAPHAPRAAPRNARPKNQSFQRRSERISAEGIAAYAASPHVVTSPSEFGRESKEFVVYIDESWPGAVAPEKESRGVIAGLVWSGGKPDHDVLPPVQNHSGIGDPMLAALGRMHACVRCFPFIMPITTEGVPAPQLYDRLLESALKLLLGWLLPGDGAAAEVRILVEQFSPHSAGHNETETYRLHLKNASRQNAGRFARWHIEEVRWCEKEVGYLGYADFFAYLAMEHHEDLINFGEAVEYTAWPGYVPLFLDLVPRLERLEMLEKVGNVGDVLELIHEIDGTALCRLVVMDLRKRLAPRPDLQLALLTALDELYRAKDRDLGHLRRMRARVQEIVPALPSDASYRMQLEWAAVALQDANHDGDPARLQKEVARYLAIRADARQHDRELSAFVDLNLAVHYADRFEFGEAARLVAEMMADPLFPALSPLMRGRAHSSRGQYHAMMNEHDDAEAQFELALGELERADLTAGQRKGEMDQTSVYRAINALDAETPDALELVESVIGPLEQAAARLATSCDDSYHHHLLLRALQADPDLEGPWAEYRARRHEWVRQRQHPWPLIDAYRGVLLWMDGDCEAAVDAFDHAIDSALDRAHGPTLHLIGAAIATVAHCLLADRYEERARNALALVEPQLPGATSAITVFRGAFAQPDPDRFPDVLAALPFNYH